MIERGKTILLILLVCTSLLQSYLLAYHSTDYEAILQSEYVDTEIIGTQEKQEKLIFPHQIVLHEDTDNHKILYPEHYFYKLILGELQNGSYEGLRVSDKSAILLRQMMNQQRGVEIRFPSNLPVQLIRNAIPFDIGLLVDTEWVRTIWITETEGKAEIYLIGENYSDTYEVVRTSVNSEKIKEYINFGKFQTPNYLVSSLGYLYPEEAVPMLRVTHNKSSLTNSKMENMLFPDPGITRNWSTSDGLEIYSDGKRGLEINSQSLWMSFTDPMARLGSVFSPQDGFSTAVQFVNQHGGWNGKFQLERVERGTSWSKPQMAFRQYVKSFPMAYPVLYALNNRFGQIDVVLEGDVVTEYERSLLIAEPDNVERTEVYLAGGEALKRRLENLGLALRIESVTPALKPVISRDTIEFIPVWAVYLDDGTLLELP